jgi:hypothetical protein
MGQEFLAANSNNFRRAWNTTFLERSGDFFTSPPAQLTHGFRAVLTGSPISDASNERIYIRNANGTFVITNGTEIRAEVSSPPVSLMEMIRSKGGICECKVKQNYPGTQLIYVETLPEVQ